MEKQLIDLAYELAKTKYNKKPFTFKQLWKELIKQARLDKEEQAQAGYVYTTMLQDNRFIFIGDSQWKITEFLTEEQISEYANALYDFKKEAEEEEARIKKISKEDDYVYEDSELNEEYGQTKSNELEEDEDSEDEEDDGEEVEEDEEEEEEKPSK